MTARPVRQPRFRTARADGPKGSIPSGTGPRNGAAASALPVGSRLPGKPRPETVAAQAGAAGDPSTGAIVPPIHLATTFVRDADNRYRRGYCYGRSDNATVRQVEHVLNELEHGAASLLFASGMAAATSAFLALERPAHVVAPTQMYWGLRQWLMQDAPSHGLDVTFIDAGSVDALRTAIRAGPDQARLDRDPIEPDLGGDGYRGGGAARPRGWRAAGGRLHGADAGAHPSYVVWGRSGGALGDQVPQRPLRRRCGGARVSRGRTEPLSAQRACAACWAAIIGPFEAALLLRGLRTLHVRVRHQSASAMAIARHFVDHPAVAGVLYPGLASHPGHAIAARQMQGGFGGMLSMRIRGGETDAIACAARMRVWQRATSLGGVESLVEHRSSIEGAGSPCPPDLLRLSVGLENVDDLIADIAQALSAVRPGRRRRNGGRSASANSGQHARMPENPLEVR